MKSFIEVKICKHSSCLSAWTNNFHNLLSGTSVFLGVSHDPLSFSTTYELCDLDNENLENV